MSPGKIADIRAPGNGKYDRLEDGKQTMTKPEQALDVAISRLLRPIVRILLRYGMSYSGFAELAKRTFIDVAQHDYAIDNRKQSISRISAIPVAGSSLNKNSPHTGIDF